MFRQKNRAQTFSCVGVGKDELAEILKINKDKVTSCIEWEKSIDEVYFCVKKVINDHPGQCENVVKKTLKCISEIPYY